MSEEKKDPTQATANSDMVGAKAADPAAEKGDGPDQPAAEVVGETPKADVAAEPSEAVLRNPLFELAGLQAWTLARRGPGRFGHGPQRLAQGGGDILRLLDGEKGRALRPRGWFIGQRRLVVIGRFRERRIEQKRLVRLQRHDVGQ